MAIVYVNFSILLSKYCMEISYDVLSQKYAVESQNLVAVGFVDSAGAVALDVLGCYLRSKEGKKEIP